jgi:hypothetical protein
MANCEKCGTVLDLTTITYISRKREGESDGKHYSFETSTPTCGKCGKQTVSYDSKAGK